MGRVIPVTLMWFILSPTQTTVLTIDSNFSLFRDTVLVESKINVLEANNAIWESHVAHLKSNQEDQVQYFCRLCFK